MNKIEFLKQRLGYRGTGPIDIEDITYLGDESILIVLNALAEHYKISNRALKQLITDGLISSEEYLKVIEKIEEFKPSNTII